jgi:trk system potassium uptake protein TrkA
VALGEFSVDPSWIGRRYTDIERATAVSVSTVSRYGQGLMPHADLVVQQDDRMHASYEVAREAEIIAILASAPEVGK